MARKAQSPTSKQDERELSKALSFIRVIGDAHSELERLKETLSTTTVAIIERWASLERALATLGVTMGGEQEASLRRLLDAVVALDFAGELVLPRGRGRSSSNKGRPVDAARMVSIGFLRQRGDSYAEISEWMKKAGYEQGERTTDSIKARLRELRRRGWKFESRARRGRRS